MRVLDVQVVIARLDLVDGHAPGVLVLLAVLPPRLFQVELLDRDRPRLGVLLAVGGQGVLEIPDLLGRLALGEEEQVGVDAGIGGKDAVGQAHDGVQVAVWQQALLDARLDPLAKERAVGQDDGRPCRLL